MSTVIADPTRLLLPSEALEPRFEVSDALLPGAPDAEQSAARITVHAVRVADIGLLLPRDEISEIVESASVCRLPNTSTWFDGITSLRGNMIPVFDLHQLFDFALPRTQRRLVVIGQHERAVAFWVDDFPRLIGLGDEDAIDAAPPLPSLLRDHAIHYYRRDDQTWVDWNVDGFVTTLGEML